MKFSGAVIISLLLHHLVLSSEGSFLKEKILLKEESLLEKFFAETKLFLDEDNTRHVTVVGESDDQLRQTKPLLDTFPYFIGSDVAMFCESIEFAPDTSVIQFLSSMKRKYLSRIGRSLSDCKGSRTYLIFEGNTVRYDDLDWIPGGAFKKFTKLPIFVHHTKKFLKFYGTVMTANCTGVSKLLVDWRPGVDTKKLVNFHEHISHQGCPLPVSTRHQPPWMNLEKDVNGTVRIIGGSEGEMISAIAQKMNFTPLVQTFELPDKVRAQDKVLLSCAAGNTSMGIAQIRPTEWVYDTLDTSLTYTQECVVCAIPRIRSSKLNILAFEFSPSSWLLIVLTFLVSLGIEKIVRSTHYLNRGNANRSGWCSIILDLIGSTLGNPIFYRPISFGSKILLIMYLCYSTVITTAYKSALSSVFTVDDGESIFSNAAEFYKANVTPAGSIFKLTVLQDQIDEYNVSELIKRFVIEPNGTKILQRVSRDKDFAYLTSLYHLAYDTHLLAKAGVQVKFDLRKQCEIIYGNVIVLPKSSHLTKELNRVMHRLLEAGLVEYWMKKNVPNYEYVKKNFIDSRSAQFPEIADSRDEFRILNSFKYYYIFRIFGLALVFCIVIFFGELLVHKLIIAGRGRRLKNIKRFRTKRRRQFQSKSRYSN